MEMTKTNNTDKKISQEERHLNRLATFFFQVEYAKRSAYWFDREEYLITKKLYKSLLSFFAEKNIIVDRVIQAILNYFSNENNLKDETHTIPSDLLPVDESFNRQTIRLEFDQMELLRSLKNKYKYFLDKYLLLETDLFSDMNLASVIHNFSYYKLKDRIDKSSSLFYLPNTIFCHEKKKYIIDSMIKEYDTGKSITIEINLSLPFSYKAVHQQVNELLHEHVPSVFSYDEIYKVNYSDTIVNLFNINNHHFTRQLLEAFESPTLNGYYYSSIVPRLIGLWLWDRKNNTDFYNPQKFLEKIIYGKTIFEQFDHWKCIEWDEYISYLQSPNTQIISNKKSDKRNIVAEHSTLNSYINYNYALEITEKSIKNYEREKIILI